MVFDIKKNKKTILNIIILFVLQLIVCLWFGYQKQSFFCDEIYSYGLANSSKYSYLLDEINRNNPSIDNKNANILINIGQKNEVGWFSSTIFKDYVTSDIKDIFNYKYAYKNQVKDNHPPLYLFLLHTFSSLSGDNLTKWTGISLNLLILFFMNFAFFYVAKDFLQDEKKTFLTLILYSFCAGGISNILFIRMYFLLSFEIILYVAANIRLYKKGNNCSFGDYALICSTIIAGGLTHYHFYIFSGIFSILYSFFLLYQKSFIILKKYILALILGIIFNTIFFPTTWLHIFKGIRCVQAFSLLGMNSARNENVFLTYYADLINKSLLGNTLLFIFLFIIGFYLYKSFQYKTSQIKENFLLNITNPIFGISVFTTTLFLYIATQGAIFTCGRYIYCIYPFLAIITVAVLFHILDKIKRIQNHKYIICLLFILFMCYKSFLVYGIEFQYQNLKKTEQEIKLTKGSDCLIYLDRDWRDIYSFLPIKFDYDEIYYLQEFDIDNLENILNARKTKDNLVIDFFLYSPVDEQHRILDKILEKTKYNNYKMLYKTDSYILYSLF